MKREQKKNGNEPTSHFEYRTITKDMKDEFTYIDLGLPSGRLWATENAEGYYTFNESEKKFGELLPSPEAFEELWKECQWLWDVKNKGMIVVGPNKNTIFLPSSGYRDSTSRDIYDVGFNGSYWSYVSSNSNGACSLCFYPDSIYPLEDNFCALGFSVRLCLTSNNAKNETI